MSVLLDALKKAADEKKNAENSEKNLHQEASDNAVDQKQDVSSLEPESFSNEALTGQERDTEETSFKFKLSNNDVNSENASADNFEAALYDPDVNNQDLNIDMLNNDSNIIDSPKLKIEKLSTEADSETIDIESQVDPLSDNSDDLAALIDSLDSGQEINESLTLNSSSKIQKTPSNMGLSLSTDENYDSLNDTSGETFAESSHDSHGSFDWSMDDLPGYMSDSTSRAVGDARRDLSSTVSNPILVSGANVPPKKGKNRYATSSKVFLSLFVFLLFVVISFYGILYYQEQNESLEKSMMKYNLSALNISPKQPNVTSTNVAPESHTTNQNNEILVVVPKKENDIDKKTQENIDLDVMKADATDKSELKTTANIVKANSVPSSNGKVKSTSTSSKKRYDTTLSKRTNDPIKRARKAVSAMPVVEINKTKSLLAEGYEAYRAGDYSKAENIFLITVDSDPKNVNALMGLGAIAVVNKDYRSAIQYYEEVLSIKPNNLNTLEAIANLSGLVPLNANWEKQLFEVTELYPNSSVLQNACGNSYASKHNWLAAQQNYFNALANSPNNPDYMVNLAVSYDHLGEYKLASQYYTQALAYAGTSRISFNHGQVKARLVSIRQLIIKGS